MSSVDGIAEASLEEAAEEAAEEKEYRHLREVAVEAAHAGREVLRGYFRADNLQVRSKGHHDFVTRADHESEEAILGVIRDAFPDHHILAEESGHEGPEDERSDDERTDEELAADRYQWLVDPLDGTSNFLQGVPVFCISIACRHRGRGVAAAVLEPLRDDLFTAHRGGGATLNGENISASPRPGLEGAFLATGYPFRAHEALDTYLECFRDIFVRTRGIRRLGAAALDLAYTAAGIFDGFFEFRLSPWDIAAGSLLVQEAGGVVTDLDGGDGFLAGGNVVAGGPGVHEELLRVIGGRVDEALLDRLERRAQSSDAGGDVD